jgi:glycosyltransferase 2 family protein
MRELEPHRRWHVGAWLSGLLVLAGVVLITARIGEARRFEELLRRAQPLWLLAAVFLQAMTYVCAAAIWSLVLRRSGALRPLRSLIVLGLAKLFTDQALPSGGISGTFLLVQGLARRGVPLSASMSAVLVSLLAFYGAFALCGATSVVILGLHGDLKPAVVALAMPFVVVVSAMPAAIMWLYRKGPSAAPKWLTRLPGVEPLLRGIALAPPATVRDPKLIAQAIALDTGIFVLDAATLGTMLAAIGQPVPPDKVFASFVIASVAQMLGVVPGGLGTFEATQVALLALLGVSVEPALTATLLLRGFTFWIPLAPGMWIARREVAHA